MSCYVNNGFNDPFLALKANGMWYPITVLSNDWNLVSQEFNSGTDTVVIVGFYSDAACFDFFKVTCDPLVTISEVVKNPPPFSIVPTMSSNQFEAVVSQPCKMEIVDIQGSVVERVDIKGDKESFGQNLIPGTYFLRIFSEGQVYFCKVVKL